MQTEHNDGARRVREALETILDRNGDKWRRFISGILKNEADAEDIVQEAVRRVLTRDKPLLSEEAVRMYLGRSIGNAAMERFNRRKLERRRQIPVAEDQLAADTWSPHDCIEAAERSAEREELLFLLREGLRHLPAKQYEALRLTILDCSGASIRDVGMNHGIPYSTLRHRSQQGLRNLRRYLAAGKRRANPNGSREPGIRMRGKEKKLAS